MPAPPQDDWDRHWENYAAAASLNPAQRMRHRLIERLILQSHSPIRIRICDIGSGQGDLIAALARALPQAEFVGLELSATGVEIARRKVPSARFHIADLCHSQAEDFGLRAWATHAVCSEVLEHVDDPLIFLQATANYLAPGGLLIVTVPGGPMSAFDRHLGHRQHFDREKIRGLLERSGFAVERVCLTGFPFFNLYRLTVILRGRKLIEDVNEQTASRASSLATVTMRLFRALFIFNLMDSPLGWQVIAIARKPA
jgi:SAM-dependent methyltransferase